MSDANSIHVTSAPVNLDSCKVAPTLSPAGGRKEILAFPQGGFTLLEAVMVIVITGIIAAIVAIFIKQPVASYFDAARRAELTDVADTAVRRMARDIHLALPNSVRNPGDGSNQCVEFIPTKIGARYRAAPEAGGGDALDFTLVDPSFDMLWPNSLLPVADQIAANDVVVVYNDGSSTGNAYTGRNAIQVGGLGAGGTPDSTAITFVAAGATLFSRKQLPSESPANRFQVIPADEHVVSYRCNAGVLSRHTRSLSALTTTWLPNTCGDMTVGATTTALLAQNVSACSLKYEPPGSGTGPRSRFGIVSISLEITQVGESVKLYHQVHVDNTP